MAMDTDISISPHFYIPQPRTLIKITNVDNTQRALIINTTLKSNKKIYNYNFQY